MLVETITDHNVRAGFLLVLCQSVTKMQNLTLTCLCPSVQSLDPADGAPAVHALLRPGGGVCHALPPATGDSVQEADGASAAEG